MNKLELTSTIFHFPDVLFPKKIKPATHLWH
uniref:Uncharacterized protein n=1 Tax=Rhizophora mucronata TaxID=61149 RepID=A0A2P2NVH2_RHIMU